jgi:magnesium transporter
MSSKSALPLPPAMRTITWGDLTWTDITDPTEESRKYLAEHFSFHPLDLEDVLTRQQLSKTEEYPAYLFVVFHLPVYDKATQVSARRQWSAFVGDKFLVTLRPRELKSAEEVFRDCEASDDTKQELMSRGSGYLLYSILDRAIDSYFPVLNKILSLIDGIEDSVFDEGVEVGKETSILRRDIITQRRVMFPTRALFAELEPKLKRFTKNDLTLYFSDLMDHMNKICDTLDEYEEVIEVYKDADSQLSDYRANNGIRVLAVLFAIGLPFIIVDGVRMLLPTAIDWSRPAASFGTLGAVAVLIVTTLVVLRRRHLV